MKKINALFISLCLTAGLLSCDDKEWDSHYSQQETVVNSTELESIDKSVTDFIKGDEEFSSIADILEEQGILKAISSKNQLFTLLAFPNDKLAGLEIEDPNFFAKSLVCDLYIAPSKCTNGMSLLTWCGKYLDVTVTEESAAPQSKAAESASVENVIRIGGQRVTRVIKLNNAFVYVLDAPVVVPKSLYEYLEFLDDENYSRFKQLVYSYEIKEFDKANSTPSGVDNTGNTIYDSVFTIKNTYMDRYKKSDYKDLSWSMRSEYFKSTMLIPNNEQVETAFNNACQFVINSLRRQPTSDDTTNFNEWILNACFYGSVLTPEQLAYGAVSDLSSNSGYCPKYSASVEKAVWRPTVQQVNTTKKVELSNGVAYYIESFKIPNNVILWRLKNRMAVCWSACSADEKAEYFIWKNTNPAADYPNTRNASGSNGPYGDFPIIYYDFLYAPASPAVCSQDSVAYGGAVSLTFTLVTVQADGTVAPVMVPPGEYYLRAGSSYTDNGWTADWYLQDHETKAFKQVAAGWIPKACFLDRYGSGFPKYFDPVAFGNSNAAKNYDRDGGDVATITIPGTEPHAVVLKIESKDLYKKNAPKDSRSNCLALYCWTLRPTSNNY